MTDTENPIIALLRDMGRCVITISAENKEGVASVVMPSARFDNYINVIRKDEGEDPRTGEVQALQFLFRVSADDEDNLLYALPFTPHDQIKKPEDFDIIDRREDDSPSKDVPLTKIVDERDPMCIERWPGCYSGDFNPACCRFPKSCSAGITRLVPVEGEEDADHSG